MHLLNVFYWAVHFVHIVTVLHLQPVFSAHFVRACSLRSLLKVWSQTAYKHTQLPKRAGAAETDEAHDNRKNGEKAGCGKPETEKNAGAVFQKTGGRGGDGRSGRRSEKRGKSEGGKSATGEKSEADF